jgi:hypothetical protein
VDPIWPSRDCWAGHLHFRLGQVLNMKTLQSDAEANLDVTKGAWKKRGPRKISLRDRGDKLGSIRAYFG